MEDDKLYKQALEEMKELAERVLEECCEFAEDNDYEKEWVISHFISAFNKLKKRCIEYLLTLPHGEEVLKGVVLWDINFAWQRSQV